MSFKVLGSLHSIYIHRKGKKMANVGDQAYATA